MAPPTELTLLDIPSEILLLIFYETSTIQDACALARTCSQLHGLFSPFNNKISILRSAANVSRRPKCDSGEDLPAVIRIPPLNWAFRSSQNPKCGLLMEINYGPLSEELTASTMWNLGIIQRRQSKSRMFNRALHDFLSQFQELERRWRGYFEHATENILASAARLQLEILHRSESSFVPTDLSSETTVIALALHLLLVVRDISIVDDLAVPCTEEVVFADGPLITFDGGYESNRLIPSLRVHKKNEQEWTEIRLAETSQKPSYSLDASPNVMMEYIIQSSFRLLDAHDPRHWPTVLFIILILYLCLPDMSPFTPWMSAIKDASGPLLPVLKDLARYYYISTDGGRLMSDSWADEDFAARVGHHEERIKYARMLNELWLETGRLQILVQQSPANDYRSRRMG
ncbi:hypothetical protein Aspvir_009525 [Aspergillus viridinutans]|uniref:F-box domain-containing protein n=1 Tax=Aspergillus viridinutans TaxID=75553 RepID=A0A9P3C014_ASPVI|nr:uncharacterized protein Aspvir_009525 [Aspergillus viridinutans]GIK05415.1 hypothetical protein Aspvir_009525 [Aspergillus viridinutans]